MVTWRRHHRKVQSGHGFYLYLATLFVTLGLHSGAAAQTQIGPFEITGYYQFTANPATGHTNPNNYGLLDPPGVPNFLLLRQLLDLRVFGKFNDNWTAFFQPRLFHDITKSADSRLP